MVIHTVDDKDGLTSLELIAGYYGVTTDELRRKNPYVTSRFPPGHPRFEWLMAGDKIIISQASTGAQARAVESPLKVAGLDYDSWRAFLFVLADEVLPSAKLVRKVWVEVSGPQQASYIKLHPEIFGMAPPDPLAPFSLGEHALGFNQSRYLSASTKAGGAPNMAGRVVYIDVKKTEAAGAKIHSTEEIIADLQRLVDAHPNLKERVDKLKKVMKDVEGEVLIEAERIPASAIKSAGAVLLTRGLRVIQVFGMAFTVYDVSKATMKSVERRSVKPITAEAIRQVGGWSAAVAGAKAGGVVGALAGSESGPGAILSGFAVALVFGTAGYIGADWVADFIDKN